jgi:DNA-binding response OmpR family regulator
VLEELLRAEGAVGARARQQLERVLDEYARPVHHHRCRVTVMTLRKKLGEPRVVHTVVGAGYRPRRAVSGSRTTLRLR